MSNLLFKDFQPLAAIATTPAAAHKLKPLCQEIGAILWIPESIIEIISAEGGQDEHSTIQIYYSSLKEHIANLWKTQRGLIFCLASGAVMRLIAPLLQHKSEDPAIVIIDENGKFAISLCSGHQGGADKLATAIALQINATAVLTGASTSLGLPGIDIFGIPFGWQRGSGDWTKVSAAIARQETVDIIQESGTILWQNHLPKSHTFNLINHQIPKSLNPGNPNAKIYITCKHEITSPPSDLPQIQWHPRVLWVGVGCERGTSQHLIETAIQQVCYFHNLSENAIAGIATIDIKADEIGIIELCKARNWCLRTFSAEVLRLINVPNPSAIVQSEVGTPSVCEAAALAQARCQSELLGGQDAHPTKLLVDKLELLGGQDTHPTKLLVEKQIFRLPSVSGAVTVAIAEAEIEYTGKSGNLLLVGIGPGKLAQMTPAAQTAISQADAVIGYSLYIDLISSLLRPGQIVEALPITQEKQRAERAIALAKWGLNVAVISSGDCGIYGMGGLVFEELQAKGWDGKTPGVQMFPGITALQAAASRVGAPLMHDFCAISLSDLLTPWEVIEKRLTAAAAADFVTALYNPKSQTRTKQIEIAQTIFLQYRHPNTPVAVVHSAYREDEEITLTTLEKLLEIPIDMLTTVLIGNQSTRTYANWMITPRGYLGFNG